MKKAIVGICALAVAAVIGTGAVISSASTAEKTSVGAEKALEIALSDAGISKEQAKEKSSVFTKEHGKYVFDVDFDFENKEYDYKIAAKDGSIVDRKVEIDEDETEPSSAETVTEPTTERKSEPPSTTTVPSTTVPSTTAAVTELTTAEPQTAAATTTTVPSTRQTSTTAAPSTTQAAKTTHAQTTKSGQSYRISATEAKKIALSDAGVNASQAKFTKIKLEKDNGIYEYEIEFFANSKEYDYSINAVNGAILEKDVDSVREPTTAAKVSTTAAPKPTSGLISINQAKEIALSHAGLGENEVVFKKVKLEKDDGIYEYEVEFQKGFFEYEYSINAKSGEIIDFEKEFDN